VEPEGKEEKREKKTLTVDYRSAGMNQASAGIAKTEEGRREKRKKKKRKVLTRGELRSWSADDLPASMRNPNHRGGKKREKKEKKKKMQESRPSIADRHLHPATFAFRKRRKKGEEKEKKGWPYKASGRRLS